MPTVTPAEAPTKGDGGGGRVDGFGSNQAFVKARCGSFLHYSSFEDMGLWL